MRSHLCSIDYMESCQSRKAKECDDTYLVVFPILDLSKYERIVTALLKYFAGLTYNAKWSETKQCSIFLTPKLNILSVFLN